MQTGIPKHADHVLDGRVMLFETANYGDFHDASDPIGRADTHFGNNI
ncbi:hypothetical protein MTBUT4_180094 [Magnetospirillum sp. UT-4]|nr:hypothetical protein MTBUT4_180094 [Magnetospirillum sp. UT-4]